MDERTLNDLLECSVCLERLDTSSKVLPCQHTFCRKCLEVIVSSRHELRCPECRVLVDIKIDDLPPNILLMRILEGMKNANQSQHHNSSNDSNKSRLQYSIETNKTDTTVTLVGQKNNELGVTESSKKNSINNDQHNRASSEQNSSISQNNTKRGALSHAFALHDFVSEENGDLNFKKGDIIFLKRKLDINWLFGELNGKEGAIPVNYVQIIVPLPIPQCIALYDFKMGPNEDEGCLSFKKGTRITVLRRIDYNWAEGRIGSHIGIFPIAFAEMNKAAKELLVNDMNNSNNSTSIVQSSLNSIQVPRALPSLPTDGNNSTSDSTRSSNVTSPSSPCSSNSNNSNSGNSSSTNSSLPSSPTANALTKNSPQQQQQQQQHKKDIKEKRHSLNTLLNNTNLSCIQSNRHSAEILSGIPVEPNITETTSVTNENQSATVAPSTSASSTTLLLNKSTKENPFQTQHSVVRTNVLKTSGQSVIPTSFPWAYVALYPYKPRKPDELELKKGCVYFVTERCLDGWYKGKNWADKSGVFPGNYVTALRSRDQQQLIHQRKNHNVTQQSFQATSSQILIPSLLLPAQNNQIDNVSHSFLQQQPQQKQQLPPPQPPELPPRSNTIPSTTSIWTKPLGHHMESFFNRKLNNLQQQQQKSTPNCDGGIGIGKSTVDVNLLMNKNLNSTGRESALATAAVATPLPQLTKEKDKKELNSAISLMKRLTNNIKRSKSPTTAFQVNCSIDNPGFEDIALPTNTTSVPSSSKQSVPALSSSHPIHVRSGSCPSQLLQSLPVDFGNIGNGSNSNSKDIALAFGSQRLKSHKDRPSLQNMHSQLENYTVMSQISNKNIAGHKNTIQNHHLHRQQSPSPSPMKNNSSVNHHHQQQQQQQHQHNSTYHRKTQSLDAGVLVNDTKTSSNNGGKSSSPNMKDNRFRCIVSYPPNSEMELELNVGDIVFVHKKLKNGWYKGTHSKTNKTGLFPASFVEPDI